MRAPTPAAAHYPASGVAGVLTGGAVGRLGGRGCLQGQEEPAEGVLFLPAPGQPDVVLAHGLADAGGERGPALVDQLAGAGQLGLQLGQEGGVGGELVAGHP